MIVTGVAYLVWMLLGFMIGAMTVGFGVNALLDDFGMSREFHEKLDDFMSGDDL